MGDDKPILPHGCSLVDRGGCVTARCACDWFATRTTTDQAIDAAFEHARTDAWCYVHRNLTPVGADPVTGEAVRAANDRLADPDTNPGDTR